ncbi:MAG TPA: SurA N-terminal domain-containing protein [Chloroflexota bacterium]
MAFNPRGPTRRQLSRAQRERYQRRLLFGISGGILLAALSIVGVGLFHELVQFPGEPVAIVYGQPVTLRTLRDSLSEEMRRLQTQSGSSLKQANSPDAASAGVQQLLNAQETLPEDVLENEIQKALIRYEADRRGITVPPDQIDTKINETLSRQRDILNQPTATPTPTQTPRPTPTETPEDFVASPTPTRTETPTPTEVGAPTAEPTSSSTPTLTPTVDPNASPTPTNTPRPTHTPNFTATIAPTLQPTEFAQAYRDLVGAIRDQATYRHGIEDQILAEKVRAAIGANEPTHGPRAHVLRLAGSTVDEVKVALISINGGFSTFEDLVEQVMDRPAENTESGDLGWVAKGSQMHEFDDVVFSSDTPMDTWVEPFAVGHHFETVNILEQQDDGPYDQKNLDQMKDRLYADWLTSAKTSPEVIRQLAPPERQWALDRASKGVFTTEVPR